MLSVESCNASAKYELVLLCLLLRIKGQRALHDMSNLGYLKMPVLFCSHFTAACVCVQFGKSGVHSQERHNLNKNNTSQLLPSVQEQKKAEGMKIELTEFPVSLSRSGQEIWAPALAAKSSVTRGIPQETRPAASEGASWKSLRPLQMRGASCLTVPAQVIYKNPCPVQGKTCFPSTAIN